MRVFVVLASLVALISADVSHLHGGHKTTTYTHSVPSVSYGHGSSGSYHSGSSGFAADPVVNFVQTPVRTVHNYIKPAVQTVTRYVESTPVVHHQVQAAPVVQTHYVQAAPAVQTHYVQTAPAVQTHYVQQAAPVVHQTVSRFGADNGFGGASYSQGSGFGSGATYGSGFGGSSFGGSSFGGQSNLYDSSSSYGSGHSTYRTTLIKQTAPIVTKSSYVFSAPEEHDVIQRDQTIVLPRPRVHYNAVFVKAPSSTVVNTPSVALAPQTQEKTLIYVLSDKKRLENHIQLPQLDAASKTKPQVFFIKNNQPTEKVNSHVRYETVDAVNGAEFGAHNGIANSGSSSLHGRIDDAPATGEDSLVAHTIYQGLQHQGLQGGLNAFNTLQGQGISVGSYDETSSTGSSSSSGSTGGFQSIINAGTSAASTGANAISLGTNAIGAGSNAATSGFNSLVGTVNSFFPSSSRGSFVETVETVEKPAAVSYTTTTTTKSGSSGTGDSQYYTGAIVPVESQSSSTFESDSSDAGSSFADFSSDSTSTSEVSSSGCTSC